MTRRVVIVLVLFCNAVLGSRVASAQTTDLGLSYANLTLLGSEGEQNTTYPLGWIVALTGHIDPHVAVVGEINGNYHRETIGVTDLKSDIYTFLGGARVQSLTGRATIFGQLLLGAGHWISGTTGFPDATLNTFVIQPGVGVDLSLAPRRAIRLQADVPFHHAEGDSVHAFRFGVGIVLDLR